MLIRNVNELDARPLAELASALGQAAEVSRISQDISTYASGFYVAELDNIVAGYLVMRAEHAPNCIQGRSPVQLWRLFVSPPHQGKGVASALMAHAIAYARDRAHDVVWLGTSEDNGRAIAFYRKSGFSPTGFAQLHQGDDSHHDLIMSCVPQ